MVDTVIRLFESTATEFTTNGIGVLSDAIKCEVVEERNGQFELSMEYPIDGRRFDDLALRRLIVAKPNPFDDPQPFRIYNITKPFNGRVTVSAEHISYDLSGYVVGPFTANKVGPAFTAIVANSTPQVPFTFYTDKTTDADMEVKVPTSLRSLLGGTEGSILDIYGPGEYVFDEFEVRFLASRGVNDGVTIRYGKNLTDLEQEENCAAVYTHVFPYWYSDDDGLLAPTTPVSTGGTFNYTRIMPLDLTSEFEEKPELTDLVNAATSYVQRNELGVPKVSLKVSFVQLAQSEEYKMYELLEDVRLCDTVTVEFPKLGVSATSKCIKTTYDAISGKYISLELGESRTNLSTTIERQSAEIAKNSVEKNMPVIKSAIDKATKLITGGLGGYVVMHDYSDDLTPPDGYPDEILILDELSGGVIANATNVWRWNKDGLGFSNHGYDGPYETAITSDGKIVANFILAGQMSADHIKGGTLQMGGTNAQGSYGGGVIEVYDAWDRLVFRIDQDGFNHFAYDYTVLDMDTKLVINNGSIEGYIRNNNGQWRKSGYMDLSALASGFDGTETDGMLIQPKGHLFLGSDEGYVMVNGRIAVGSYPTAGETDPGDTAIAAVYLVPGSGTGSVYIPDQLHFERFDGNTYAVNVAGSSDVRLKENVKPSDVNALEALEAVEYYKFDFKESGIHKEIGYVAQQLEKHIPTAVYEVADKVNKDRKVLSTTKKINDSELVIYATKAIKELSEKVKKLEARVAELEKVKE